MNLPTNCSEKDIDRRFGDEVMDDDNSHLCEECGHKYFWEDLECVCPESSIYLCEACLREENIIDRV